MKILIFGAAGMVGQGTLRECLAAPDVSLVMTVGRTQIPQVSPKLRQLTSADLMSLDEWRNEFEGFDACFFCLGMR